MTQKISRKPRDYPPDQAAKPAKKKSVKALSFFSGAMGLDLGLEDAGIDVVLACEVDKTCRQTILANKPDIGLIGDIGNYTSDDILKFAGLKRGEVDLMVGGPPCQSFSTAGSRLGLKDARGNLFLQFIDLILDIKPQYAVIENVRGLLSAPITHRPHAQRNGDNAPLADHELPGGALGYIVNTLQKGGYSVSFNLYNAANYGVPQVRERVVLLCSRDGKKMPYLKPTHAQDGAFDLPTWQTLRDAIEGLDEADAQGIAFPDERLKYYKMLKAGQYWKHLPPDIQKQAMGRAYFSGGGKTGFYRRLAWDKPSCTLVTHPAMPATDICHPTQNRPLSIQEYKRIQQFPDDWVVCGSIKDQYRQVGNAVPAGLGRAIGKAVLSHMKGIAAQPPKDFPFSRYKNTDDQSWAKRAGLSKEVSDTGERDLFAA